MNFPPNPLPSDETHPARVHFQVCLEARATRPIGYTDSNRTATRWSTRR